MLVKARYAREKSIVTVQRGIPYDINGGNATGGREEARCMWRRRLWMWCVTDRFIIPKQRSSVTFCDPWFSRFTFPNCLFPHRNPNEWNCAQRRKQAWRIRSFDIDDALWSAFRRDCCLHRRWSWQSVNPAPRRNHRPLFVDRWPGWRRLYFAHSTIGRDHGSSLQWSSPPDKPGDASWFLRKRRLDHVGPDCIDLSLAALVSPFARRERDAVQLSFTTGHVYIPVASRHAVQHHDQQSEWKLPRN